MVRALHDLLKPYKLNIYGPGGFFKGHVDTPTNPEQMIGTLHSQLG
jgi:hypothetical protein